jgi:hypothetical protein
MLVGKRNVTLMDGDTLEMKNLNRQLFTEDQIGNNKAQALGQIYGCASVSEFFSAGRIELSESDWLMCVVDNHPARAAVLDSCDSVGCRAIIAANEKHSAESYYYEPGWRGTKLDPRLYYPEILSDTRGNPLAASSGCTGEAQVETPQLVSSNFMASALALHLYVVWGMEAAKLNKETLPSLPFKLVSNLSKMESFKVKDA